MHTDTGPKSDEFMKNFEETTPEGSGQGEPTNTGSVSVTPPSAADLERERRHQAEMAEVDAQINDLEREIEKLKINSLDLNLLAILRLKKSVLQNIRQSLAGIIRMRRQAETKISKTLLGHWENTLLESQIKLKDLIRKEKLGLVAKKTREANILRRKKALEPEIELDSIDLEEVPPVPPPIPKPEIELTDNDLVDITDIPEFESEKADLVKASTVDFDKIAADSLDEVLAPPVAPERPRSRILTVVEKRGEKPLSPEVPKIYARRGNEDETEIGTRTAIIPRVEARPAAKSPENARRLLARKLKEMQVPAEIRALFIEDAVLLEKLAEDGQIKNGELILNFAILKKFVSSELELAEEGLKAFGIKLDRFGEPKVGVLSWIFTNKSINQSNHPAYRKYRILADMREALPDQGPNDSANATDWATELDRQLDEEPETGIGSTGGLNAVRSEPDEQNERPVNSGRGRSAYRAQNLARAAAIGTALGVGGMAVSDSYDAEDHRDPQTNMVKAPEADNEPDNHTSPLLRGMAERVEADAMRRLSGSARPSAGENESGRRSPEEAMAVDVGAKAVARHSESEKKATGRRSEVGQKTIEIVLPKTGEVIRHSVKKHESSVPKPKYGEPPDIQRLTEAEARGGVDLRRTSRVLPGEVAKTPPKREKMLAYANPVSTNYDTDAEEDGADVLPPTDQESPRLYGSPKIKKLSTAETGPQKLEIPQGSVKTPTHPNERTVTPDKELAPPDMAPANTTSERVAKLFTQVLLDNSGNKIRFGDYAALILEHAPEAKTELTNVATRFGGLRSIRSPHRVKELYTAMKDIAEDHGAPKWEMSTKVLKYCAGK